jgi:amino acid adenylation domain-containing protein
MSMTSAEKAQVLQMGEGAKNPYPRDLSVHRAFEKIAMRQGARPALRFKGKTISYESLNQRANQFARHLQSLGIKKGMFVGISMDRSIDFIVAILAILKAGGVYVPIDASLPDERRAYLLEDTKAAIVVTQKFYRKFVERDYSAGNLDIETDAQDLFNILYTSGSTGKPKGVELTHRGILRLAYNRDRLALTSKDRMLHHSPTFFDAMNEEVWTTLLNGATLCIYPKTKFSIENLGRFLISEEITHAYFSARLFNLFVDQNLSALKELHWIDSGGESMSAEHAAKAYLALKSCTILNSYGPTENSVITTSYAIQDLTAIQEGVPIGRPIDHTTVYILDQELSPVPIGVVGEICVGGDGVARGYLNRPELTKEKFIPNPFGPGQLYRTGDLGKFLPDGNILFVGRLDHQVKIGGCRVELGEVEEALRRHPAISCCAVLPREDLLEERCLVAYVEPKRGKTLSAEELAAFTKSKLSPYLVPSEWKNRQKRLVAKLGRPMGDVCAIDTAHSGVMTGGYPSLRKYKHLLTRSLNLLHLHLAPLQTSGDCLFLHD